MGVLTTALVEGAGTGLLGAGDDGLAEGAGAEGFGTAASGLPVEAPPPALSVCDSFGFDREALSVAAPTTLIHVRLLTQLGPLWASHMTVIRPVADPSAVYVADAPSPCTLPALAL